MPCCEHDPYTFYWMDFPVAAIVFSSIALVLSVGHLIAAVLVANDTNRIVEWLDQTETIVIIISYSNIVGHFMHIIACCLVIYGVKKNIKWLLILFMITTYIISLLTIMTFVELFGFLHGLSAIIIYTIYSEAGAAVNEAYRHI